MSKEQDNGNCKEQETKDTIPKMTKIIYLKKTKRVLDFIKEDKKYTEVRSNELIDEKSQELTEVEFMKWLKEHNQHLDDCDMYDNDDDDDDSDDYDDYDDSDYSDTEEYKESEYEPVKSFTSKHK